MADPPQHKYKTRASIHNQNVENSSIMYNDLSSDLSSDDLSDYSELTIESRKKQKQRFNNKRSKPNKEVGKLSNDPEIQYPSKWINDTVIKKLPYHPQMGDTVVYFHQGHELYLKEYNYDICLPQLRLKSSLKVHYYCKVTGMKFENLPPQICIIELSILDDDEHLTGETFTVRYHYLSKLRDFVVLKQVFEEALEKNFSIGMKVASYKTIKNKNVLWVGTIESIAPIDMKFPTSHFMCCQVKGDDGNSDTLSPWDLEPLDNQNLPSKLFLYRSEPNEWPLLGQDLVCERMIQYLDQLIYLPFDIDIHPDQRKVVAYPINLSIIRARLENRYYRRITALKFDLRYLQINAELHNEPNSQIVKKAAILTDVCLDILKNIDKELDIKGLYEKVVRSYATSDLDMEVKCIVTKKSSVPNNVSSSPKKRTNDDRQIDVLASIPSTSLKISPERQPIRKTVVFPKNVIGDWKSECKYLLKVLWNDQDSIPFRNPVDPIDFPDYEHIVPTQMCLLWVRNSLEYGEYKNPKNFEKDMKMIFSNSRLYNVDQNSEIYKMTTRLWSIFQSFMESILEQWTADRKNDKQNKKYVKGPVSVRTPMMDVEEDSSSSDNDEDDNDSDYVPEIQSTMESEDLSQITVDLSQISTFSSALIENVTNFNDVEDDTDVGNRNDWEEGWTQVLEKTPVLDKNFYTKNN